MPGDISDDLTSDRKRVDYFRACYLVPLPCACNSLNCVRLLPKTRRFGPRAYQIGHLVSLGFEKINTFYSIR